MSTEPLDLNVIRRQHALGYGQCHVDDLIAEVARLTAERDQLKADNEIKDAAVEGAIRRAERAEQRLEIATKLLTDTSMELYFKVKP